MHIVGVDLALRNSACVRLDNNLKLVDQLVITSSAQEYNNEDLLLYNQKCLDKFIGKDKDIIVMIEGLAFNSTSLAKDIIAGNFWNIRLGLYAKNIEYHIVAPASWRANVFSKELKEKIKNDRKECKDNGKSYAGIKEAALSCVPKKDQETFKSYLTSNKYSAKFLFDLSDAWCMASYGVKLFNESN